MPWGKHFYQLSYLPTPNWVSQNINTGKVFTSHFLLELHCRAAIAEVNESAAVSMEDSRMECGQVVHSSTDVGVE